MSYPVRVKTNALHGTAVTIKDLGIQIPASGGFEEFSDDDDLQMLIGSRDLYAYLHDNAHSPSGSTLLLNDGTSNIPEADADSFLLMSLVPTSGNYSTVSRNSAGEVDQGVAFDGTAEVSNLKLGSDLNANGYDITGLPNPPGAGDCATSKDYVDSVAQGLAPKPSVRMMASTAISPLSGDPGVIDGVTPATGNRVLLINQGGTTPPTADVENGIWVINLTGAWTHPPDFPSGGSAKSAYVFVEEGTTYADTSWLCLNDSGDDEIDADALLWAQFSGRGSRGRTLAFGIPLGVPSGGLRYLQTAGGVVGSSATYRAIRPGTITGASIQVNAVDATRNYNLLILVNNVQQAVVSLNGVIGNEDDALYVPYVKGDLISTAMLRTSGGGASTFSNVVALLDAKD